MFKVPYVRLSISSFFKLSHSNFVNLAQPWRWGCYFTSLLQDALCCDVLEGTVHCFDQVLRSRNASCSCITNAAEHTSVVHLAYTSIHLASGTALALYVTTLLAKNSSLLSALSYMIHHQRRQISCVLNFSE